MERFHDEDELIFALPMREAPEIARDPNLGFHIRAMREWLEGREE